MMIAQLSQLIDRQRPGWSLERPFYTSPEIFELERTGWLARQWFVLGHRSEISHDGAYIVRELLGESIIVVRDKASTLRGFFNVCRHRGSRICDHDGTAAHLVCPYHAWSFNLDGSLRAAPALPDEIDKRQLVLRPIAVRDIGGLIVASLQGSSGDLDAVAAALEPGMRFHGIPEARIAARRSYATAANWKLVIENFIECYHCFPSHPEYCSVMKHVDAVARDAPDGGAAWAQTTNDWFSQQAEPASPIQAPRTGLAFDLFAASRGPIGGGRLTQSQDGKPVAPLLGNLANFDGGVSSFRCEPFVFCQALNDHAVLFHFSPRGAQATDVSISWLVSGSASGADVDIERMTWLWDVTTLQDKSIIERNAAGVRSQAYSPGPYSKLESMPARLVSRYLQELTT